MRRAIVTFSAIAAAFMTAGFAESEMWLPAVGCIGWELFVLYANTKRKPRGGARSKEKPLPIKRLYSYDNTLGVWRQEPDQRWRA